MSFYDDYSVGVVEYSSKSSWSDIQVDFQTRYPSEDYNSVINNVPTGSTPTYNTSYTSTKDSDYIRGVSNSYMSNSLVYLNNIKPLIKPRLEYAMKGKVSLKDTILSLPMPDNIGGYKYQSTKTNDFTRTKEYKKIMDSMYKTLATSDLSDNGTGLDLLPDIASLIFNSFSDSWNKDTNPYEEGTLAWKLHDYRSRQKKFDGIFGKLKDFLYSNGFNFSFNFKIKPDNDISITVSDNGVSSYIQSSRDFILNNKQENKSTQAVDTSRWIDTYEYMAGGSMYCSFREPLVLGERPNESLETLTHTFSGTDILEKRFKLIQDLDLSDYENVKGSALWRAIDMQNKAKYIAELSAYNVAVNDINKTNEMLAIFSDKLDILTFANTFSATYNTRGYLNWRYNDYSPWKKLDNSSKYANYWYADYKNTIINMFNHFKTYSNIDWVNDTDIEICEKIYAVSSVTW